MYTEDEFPFGNDFEWKNKTFLGQGSYGKVYKVRNFHDNQFYAIKSMKMQEFNRDPTLMASLQGEIAITSQIKSNFAVQMSAFKIGRRYTYMVLQLCDSDLRKQLASRKISEPECVQIFDQIMKGFEVIVKMGYIHRDIKPANILVKNKIHKVADFGFACKADIMGRSKLTDICGTPLYMAPQLLRNQPYTAKSDIWSLGLMLFQMIFGYTPWTCRSPEEYLRAIYSVPLKFPFNARIGENTKNFICRCLVIDEQKRMSWKEVFEHPLIKHNQTGAFIPNLQINEYLKKILLKLQNNVMRRSVNVIQIIKKYKQEKINEPTFAAMIREIDPTITSHQISTLFSQLDSTRTGWVDWRAIKEKVLNVDFREQDDILSRKIDDIVAILRERKENPALLFDKIDTNHSGYIDFNQFEKFIVCIGPKYSKNQVLQLFQLLDKDRNGLISRQEFAETIIKKMPLTPKHQLASARGLRNVKALAQYMKWSQMTPQYLMQLGDEDRQAGLTKVQFEHLMNYKLKFTITLEQVDEVFNIIDKSQNGLITLDELIMALNSTTQL